MSRQSNVLIFPPTFMALVLQLDVKENAFRLIAIREGQNTNYFRIRGDPGVTASVL